MSSIAILVPVCGRNQNYSNFKDTPFVKYLHKGLLSTIDNKHEYTIFIGIDSTDTFYAKHLGDFLFLNAPSNLAIKPIILYDCEHKPAFAWNKLFQEAYSRGHDYFFQIGDDVEISGDWTNKFIESIESNSGVGVTGCLEKWNATCRRAKGQPLCLENAFVGRKHYEFFGSFFNGAIENWFCDDWITQVYSPDYVTIHDNLEVKNKIRYDGDNAVGECSQQDDQSFRYKVKNIESQQFNDMIRSDRKKIFGDSLEFTSALGVALFTTKKEYESGKVHTMMDNYFNSNPSSNFLFDLFIIFDQGEESKYEDLLKYSDSENIQNIFIKTLNLSDSQNMYSRVHHRLELIPEYRRLGEPELGTTSGPNNLFYNGMSFLQDHDYENFLALETDTRPIVSLWFDILHNSCIKEDFLILGSNYKGNQQCSTADWWKEHLNGVAIYKNCNRVKDLIKKAKYITKEIISLSWLVIERFNIKDIESPIPEESPEPWKDLGSLTLCLSYDLAIYLMTKEDPANQYEHLFKNSDFITNASLPEDSSIKEKEILSKFPETVILHQKPPSNSRQPQKVPVFLHIPKNAGTYIMELLMVYFSRIYKESKKEEDFFIKRITIESKSYNLTVFVKFLDDTHKTDPSIQHHPHAIAANYNHPKARACDLNTLQEYIKNKRLEILAINVEPISEKDMRVGLFEAYELLNLCEAKPFNFTILRDALSRQQSLFDYLTSKDSSHEPTHGSISQDTFVEYLNSEGLEDSWLIRVLSGIPHNMNINQYWMGIVVQFLESQNFLIGDISKTDDIINEVLNDCFGEKINESDKQSIFRNSTKNKDKITINGLNEKTKQNFLDQTYWDKKLWERYCK